MSFQLHPELKIYKGETIWVFGNRIAWHNSKPLTGDWMPRILVSIVAGYLSAKPKPLPAPVSIYTDPKSDNYYPLTVVNDPQGAQRTPRPRMSRLAPELDPEIQSFFANTHHGDPG